MLVATTCLLTTDKDVAILLIQADNSDYTHMRHSMWKVYLGWVSQSSSIHILIQS